MSSSDTGSPAQDDSGSPVQDDSGSTDPPDLSGVLGEVKPCEVPLATARWTERSETSGLPARPDDGRPTEEATFLAVDDFDLDGDLDILTTVSGTSESGYSEPVRLYHWTGAAFELDPSIEVEALWQPTLGDVDGDGLRDVILAGANQWLRNDQGTLTPVALEGMGYHLPFIRILAPFDLNGDGHLDLYGAKSHPHADPVEMRDVIAWGDSEGVFTIDPDAHPSSEGGMAFSAQWIDWMGDGHPEIYVANDQGYTHGANRLWSWDTDPPVDLGPTLGVDRAHDAMGGHVADWNRDGQPDLYLTATLANVLLVSQPDGQYVDSTLVTAADPMFGFPEELGPMGWSGLFVDHDNDGHIDLFVTLGDWWFDPDVPRVDMGLDVLRSDGETFQSVGESIGIEGSGSFRGAVARDFNGDGVLDFLVSSLFGRPLWFVSDGCTANNWLEVEAPDSSRITLKLDGEDRVDWATTQSGYGAVALPVAHFGLGEHESIDGIEVILPGGSVWSLDGPIDARRRITVPPPAAGR